ncbi:hypothetical protein Tco_0964801 [Tanacetum coccineum]
MSKEDQSVDVAALPKFDMPSYESSMSAKDVKSLAIRHDIPLDLPPIALTKGWTMDKLPDDMIGLYEQWLSALDVQTLTEQVIDLRPVPFGLLFQGGLSTTWDFPSFRPVFKDTEGNVVTMFEYMRFLFLPGASISQGTALTNQDQIRQHTTPPLLTDQPTPNKTDHQKEVEVEDPKIVAIRERKARATAKKKENKRRGRDEGKGSHPHVKRRKTSVVRKDGSATYGHISSPEPIQKVNPTGPGGGNPSGAVTEIAESREDRSLHISPHDSANRSVHNYTDVHNDDEETNSLRLGSFVDQFGRTLTVVNTEVFQSSPANQSAYNSPTAKRTTSPLRPPLLVPMLRKLMVHLAPPVAQEEANALNNATALERAWFKCKETVQKLVTAKVDLEHNAKLYNDMTERYMRVKNEHDGCAEKLRVVEGQNYELSRVNKDQALRIKELEEELAKKDYALVYAERISAERAQEKKKLITQLGHEYKKSLSEPFNLAIQAGWAEGCLEEDIMDDLSRVENFDPYSDKKIYIYPDSPASGQAPAITTKAPTNTSIPPGKVSTSSVPTNN